MTYEMLRSIYVITGIAALVMAALTVGLFFLLKVPDAIDFVSGRTRRRSIEQIRRSGVGSADSAVVKSGKPAKKKAKASNTEKPVRPAGTVAKKAKETTPLVQEKATTLLATTRNMADGLSSADKLTTVLDGNAANGVVVAEQADHQNLVFTDQPFVVEFDITYVYSDIVIGEA